MNNGTLTLLDRSYLEIVDDLLTAIVGGVVNEPVVFDLKLVFYPLAEPAQDVRSIKGLIPGPDPTVPQQYSFLKQIDFVFDSGQNGIAWQDGGKRPIDGTTFYVDYFRQSSKSPLSDINVGSVTRTLSEAIGREITTVYQQIKLAYLSGFIDTATGKSLDYVVAILGITRKTKDFAVGLVTFFRKAAVDGSITIPEGTSLTTTKGDAVFQTTEERTLQQGQSRADVPIRADNAFAGDKGLVAAGTITVLSQAIDGIAQVTNFDPTTRAANDESDDDLRLRAKAALRGIGKATIAALIKVISDDRAKLDEISDPNNLNGKASAPGTVVLLVETDPGRFPSLQAAIDQTRAAGVQTTLVARFVYFKLRLNVKISAGLSGPGKDKIKNDIIAGVQSYTEGLKSGDAAVGATMRELVKTKVKDVQDAVIKEVFAWRADVGKPGADPLVEAIITSLQGVNCQDTAAVRVAVNNVISAQAPALLPSGKRIPDSTVIQGPDGQPATDGQIETADFKVVPPAQFSVVLDMQPSDIALQEG